MEERRGGESEDIKKRVVHVAQRRTGEGKALMMARFFEISPFVAAVLCVSELKRCVQL